ncbi:hypothetical protein HK104_002031 [Borealophlyctis nickersoniae]|nr:hypothetical protein HK104_002031 [Borealophlyctis nickersoniae]
MSPAVPAQVSLLAPEGDLQQPQYHYSAVSGFFEQTDLRTDAATFPLHPEHFGLLDKGEGKWTRFKQAIDALNNNGDGAVYKFVLVQRHGQGIHNVAELKYGTPLWDSYYSKLPEYFDAPLTDLGVNQTVAVNNAIKREAEDGFPLPELLVSSPLSRCLNTTRLIYAGILLPPVDPSTPTTLATTSCPVQPLVVEDFREQYGDHTCDNRRSRHELQKLYPNCNFDLLISDKDTLWVPDVRESDEHLVARNTV